MGCKSFGKNFLWGASTSAYQFEGAWNEDGKGCSVIDQGNHPPELSDFKVTSDHYHRYKEDIALMSEMGLKSYRFSIAWTRILPNGVGEINQKGVDFYNRLLDELAKYNIEPIVTMYHFDLPAALDKKGGWLNRDTIDAFENYARLLFRLYGDRVKYWLTINEQNTMILNSQWLGVKILSEKELYQQNHNMMVAHAKVTLACREILPNAKIGPAPNIVAIYPATCHPDDILAAGNYSALRNWLVLDMACFGRYNHVVWDYFVKHGLEPEILDHDLELCKKAKPDFIGFNYYFSETVEKYGKNGNVSGKADFYAKTRNANLPLTEFGWEVDPVGFHVTLREIYDRYRLPVIVTENGLGGYDTRDKNGEIIDDYRIEYLREHIRQMKAAADEGVEIWGFHPWSAIDLVSTHEGFGKRYGFVYVNRDEKDLKDLARYKKKSFYWYKDVIQSNGEKL
ncbi:glycoside hydrolase family 1 protein [Caproiciproducens sp. CPB-2]|uniref:glycoside hydrolase family 1 protein n=1 Tax=Caproiciproducens sp. CPB-2 TaxID=3030017 RepID=UPI0023DA5A22|nr:glycoside hydrolase family 1 protein [Caproiciproducens sp. CPB-2]MDF1493171.1 glycoside hydrolase family 1 protein [Caproiciproducens sp. CPB-2]